MSSEIKKKCVSQAIQAIDEAIVLSRKIHEKCPTQLQQREGAPRTSECDNLSRDFNAKMRFIIGSLVSSEKDRDAWKEKAEGLAALVEKKNQVLQIQLEYRRSNNIPGTKLIEDALSTTDHKLLLAEVEKRAVVPDYGIDYIPKDDPEGRRHTSWIKWATSAPPPEDFGKIIRIFKIKTSDAAKMGE